MPVLGTRIIYDALNARQKEIYNYQKVSALFADFGYTTIQLSDDWMGADFIAIRFDGAQYIKVQLKGRFGFWKKYRGKDLFICFHDAATNKWFLYSHDRLLKDKEDEFRNTRAWREMGEYHYPSLNAGNRDLLNKKGEVLN